MKLGSRLDGQLYSISNGIYLLYRFSNLFDLKYVRSVILNMD